MNHAVVFAGPTLDAATLTTVLDVRVHGPVARGDVLRAVEEGATALGLIDGYFERVPAVWHKEILWALAKGCRVYGAASMGALRAAELAPFGMIPVGTIAEAYLRGEFTDDDEVAVAHRGPEDGYAPLSEAMVNVRATLAAAHAAGVIGKGTHDTAVALMKRRFYAERSWALLASEGPRHGLPRDELDALSAWLPTGKVDVKRRDALALLTRMRDDKGSPPAAPSWCFEPTDAWETLRRSLARRPP
jgi:hypothetical protein